MMYIEYYIIFLGYLACFVLPMAMHTFYNFFRAISALRWGIALAKINKQDYSDLRTRSSLDQMWTALMREDFVLRAPNGYWNGIGDWKVWPKD